MKKILGFVTSAALMLSAALPASASHMSASDTSYSSEWSDYESTSTTSFTDVADTHWAADYISRACDKGWINGYPDGSFQPDNKIKRGEAVKVFDVFMGIEPSTPETNYYTYTDKTSWMIPYMESGKKLLPQYLDGPGTAALESQTITREDTVYALILALKYDDKVQYADQSVLNMFSDQGSISANLKPYIAVAVSNGIVSGYDDGTFGGTDPLSRAEFATLLGKASLKGYGSGKGINSIADLDTTAATEAPEATTAATEAPDATVTSEPVVETPTATPAAAATNVTGMVVDASGAGVSGATVTLSNGASTTTSANGLYTADVTGSSSVTITASMDGYVNAQTTMTITEGIVNYAENLKLVVEASDGTISGTVYDATVQDGIVADAEISFRENGNTRSGTIVAETVSASDGTYSITLPTGTYTAEAKKDGYSTAYTTVVSQSESAQQDITMATEMDGTVFVLTWGSKPKDLDSHLTGPTSSGSRFHVYYSEREAADGTNLDRDDVTSYGPETITLVNQIDGTYRYTVHDYTNRNSEDSTALSLSGAKVVVYVNGEYKDTYNVPVNQGGTIWTVFELNGSEITPINTMDYQSSPSLVGASASSAHGDVDLISITATDK